MYSQEKIEIALKVYHQCGSVTTTIRVLGYPTRRALYTWIANEGTVKPKRKSLQLVNTAEHPRNPPVEVKMNAIHRCFELGESIKSVSEDIGYTRTSIYSWRKKYLHGGITALINDKNIKPDTLTEGSPSIASDSDLAQLRNQLRDMQMEIDILKETINVLKKDPGIDQTALKNREKAVIIDALKSKYPLPALLKRLELSKSSYYYQEAVKKRPDKYKDIRNRIRQLFCENKQRYGYRRIYGLLKREKLTVSEKVVRQIMREEGLIVICKRRRKYNSYRGEISPSVPNKIERNFHADKPNQKWLTDITEFALPAGKVYLSVLVDCFDGLLPGWTISTTPDSVLVNTMLDQAIAQLPEGDRPMIHSDRGCHYRWPGWIGRMEKAGLERSMSKKGCSPDNAACEGLFGRLKNEMFYCQDWMGVKISEFIDILNNYLLWYNTKRIKTSLGNKSPWEYRQSLGMVA
ncbi:MAG: IS3 family transposase [Clostridiales bacterium]|nr:MAG: IS3 family transposase [Clostridiales bacterium]